MDFNHSTALRFHSSDLPGNVNHYILTGGVYEDVAWIKIPANECVHVHGEYCDNFFLCTIVTASTPPGPLTDLQTMPQL